VSLSFAQPGDGLKDLTVHLPAGLVGNPRATAPCVTTLRAKVRRQPKR
jgi:hypothetical protein